MSFKRIRYLGVLKGNVVITDDEYRAKMEVWRNREKEFCDRINALRPIKFPYRHMGIQFAAAVLSQFVDPLDIHPTCLTCNHFLKAAELCGFEGCNQRPPAEVIARGCKHYDDVDEIPF